MSAAPYRTLFIGTLVQESALSLGGRDEPAVVDAPLCLDGLGRPTLRGAGLAGALVATLRRLVGDPVPEFISGSTKGLTPSRWKTFHSHLPTGTKTEFRQHVSINAKTGAAEGKDMLFTVETFPADTAWQFMLEVDTSGDGKKGGEAERFAFAALREWQVGRCWLGREVARGMGWMRLDNLSAYRLDTGHLEQWPHSAYADDYPAYIQNRFRAIRLEGEALKQRWQHPAGPGTNATWHLEIAGSFSVGEHQDGYGLNTLSLGGHDADTLFANLAEPAFLAHFFAPDGQKCAARTEDFKPDSAIALTYPWGDPQPYLPGSSLRGVLRHALERYYRAQDKMIPDKIPDEVKRAFGNTEASGALLVRDAYLQGDWRAAWLQHHAEDEFAGGVYASSKFDRMALLEGCFGFRLHVEARSKGDLDELCRLVIKPLLALAAAGRIPLGGNIWRGQGWGNWKFEEVYCHQAGEVQS